MNEARSRSVRRVVYDTMLFYRWAALPEGRIHGTARAVFEGKVRLVVNAALLSEIKDLLTRPAIRARSPRLTPELVDAFLDKLSQCSEMNLRQTKHFTWTQHPDDDHLFNLAIDAKADYLVTWEKRILELGSSNSEAARQLRILCPNIAIITPKMLSELTRDPTH